MEVDFCGRYRLLMIKFLVCVRGTVTVCVSMSFSLYVSVFEWQISSLTYVMRPPPFVLALLEAGKGRSFLVHE